MNLLPALRPDVTLDWLNKLGMEYLPGFLGVELLELAPGRLRSRMKLAQQHFAPNNFLHAASIVALADTTCGYATFAHLPEGAASFTTIELKKQPSRNGPRGERAPNDWLRIRVESATGRFAGLTGRIMAGPIWGLEPEPS